MVATELGACEWFVWDLRRSNLIDRGQLDQIIGDYLGKHPAAEPPALAEYLVKQKILTQFQSDRLLQGKTQGFVLGPFTLMDSLGAGSMGTVYKAQSKTDNQWYAVKVLPRRSMWNVRIARRKVRSFEQAKHPAVVPFVDVGTAGGMHYLAWPYVEGETLEKVVAAETKIAPALAAKYALEVAEGLDVCHHHGLFHGLLKPSNVMIGKDNQVFILDFGIGCLLAETEGESLVDTMSTSNSVTSGLDCASPESIMDPTNLTPAGDQYSLGCILYYMLSGQYPFPEGNAAEKMMAHQFKEPTPLNELNPEIPAGLVAVVERLMKKAPDARYASTAEIVEQLRPFADKATALHHHVRPASPRETTMPKSNPAPVKISPDLLPMKAGSRNGSAAPSTPTPRPSTMGTLPARPSLRPKTTLAVQAPVAPVEEVAPEPKHIAHAKSGEDRVVPGAVPDFRIRLSLEERLGPVGVTAAAICACTLVYAAAVWLQLF